MVLKMSRDRAVSRGSLIWALAVFLCDLLSFPHVIQPCSHIDFVLILSSFMATLWPQLLNLIIFIAPFPRAGENICQGHCVVPLQRTQFT